MFPVVILHSLLYGVSAALSSPIVTPLVPFIKLGVLTDVANVAAPVSDMYDVLLLKLNPVPVVYVIRPSAGVPAALTSDKA